MFLEDTQFRVINFLQPSRLLGPHPIVFSFYVFLVLILLHSLFIYFGPSLVLFTYLFILQMIDDRDLGCFANFLGVFIFILVMAYHFAMADPKYEGN